MAVSESQPPAEQPAAPQASHFDQLWKNNPAMVQMLGLCPLLAISNTLVNSLTLALATAITVILSNACVSIGRHLIARDVRIPVYVLLIAGIVTVTDLSMQAFLPQLHDELGIFIPLIITNCAIIARAEIFASKNSLWPSVLDGFATGAGFAIVLCSLGAVREIIGKGTLLADAARLFGEQASDWTLYISDSYSGMLLAVLPPGAFILLGILLALKNLNDQITGSGHE